MRILYVEDNDSNAALVERICHMSSDDLIIFPDAESVLSSVDLESIDLILMDMHLGDTGMNGLELTNLLRQQGLNTPIVLITAYDPSGYPRQFEASNFDDYIPKPVSVNGMLSLFSNYRQS